MLSHAIYAANKFKQNNQKAYFPMEQKYLDLLVCPITKQALKYHPDTQELWSLSAKLAFPIRDGIPIMLEQEARPLSDLEVKS